MLVDCAHYRDGSRQDEAPLTLDEAARRSGDEDGFVWLGLHDPAPDELREVAERFDLPPLAVEDAMKAHQRPKLEDYDDGYFLVLHTTRYIDANIFQANLAVIGLQQNDVVRKISGWAAIIAVPTYLASIWGMNFEHVPELKWTFGYPLALSAMVLTSFGLFRVLRRAGWL